MIFPWDTYIGFRELGFNILFSFLAVLIININFSYPTRLAYSWLPDPWFRVYVRSVHKAKVGLSQLDKSNRHRRLTGRFQHGSDSGTYDPEGRFIPQLFENLFAKWDSDNDGALTLRELFQLMHGHRCAADPFGVSSRHSVSGMHTRYANRECCTVGCGPLRMGNYVAFNTEGW